MTKPPSGSSSYPPIPGSLGCRGGMTPDLDLLEKRRKKRRGGTRRPGRWIDRERGHRRAPRAAEDGRLAAIVGEPPSASGRATGWCRDIRSKFSTWRFWSVLTTAISAIRSALRTRNAGWSCAIDSCRPSCAPRAAQTSTNTAIATRLPYSSHCCWRRTRPGSNGLRLAARGSWWRWRARSALSVWWACVLSKSPGRRHGIMRSPGHSGRPAGCRSRRRSRAIRATGPRSHSGSGPRRGQCRASSSRSIFAS